MTNTLINITENDLDCPIYRILTIDRLIELFEKRKLIFPLIKTWEDVYENFFLKSIFKEVDGTVFQIDDNYDNYFGQCWSLNKDSDALWRIYSHDMRSVRIKTTIRKIYDLIYGQRLMQEGSNFGIINDVFIGKVEYRSKEEIKLKIDENGISTSNLTDSIVKSTFLKRLEFEHEKEVRILYDGDCEDDPLSIKSENKSLIGFDIDPINIIDEIAFDPRSKDSYVEAFKDYFVNRLNFPLQKIVKSNLYTFDPFVFDVK